MKKALATYIIIAVILLIAFYHKPQEEIRSASMFTSIDVVSLAPLSIQTYEYFRIAAERDSVPLKIMLGILRHETSFSGPLNFLYNPYQVSNCDALGPGQIKLSSAREALNNPQLTREDVLFNVRINADASMKYLRQKYNSYGNWYEALGYYHNGYKCVDNYARQVARAFFIKIKPSISKQVTRSSAEDSVRRGSARHS